MVFQANIEKEQNINEIRKAVYLKLKNYSSFMMGVKSNFGKEFGLYIPD